MFVAAQLGARHWGGAEIATSRLLAALAGRGHRVLLYCSSSEVQAGAEAMGVPTRLLPLGGDLSLHHALGFARALRRDRPQALILATFRKLWLGALAAHLARVPRVVARIGLETDVPRSLKYRLVLARWVHAVVTNSERPRAAFVALPGWGEARVRRVLQAPRPLAVSPGAAAPPPLQLPAGTLRVGSVARLVEQKRLDRLVRALPLLPPAVHVLLAGEGVERASLEALAGELGVSRRLHLLGHQDEVGAVLGELDLYVVCSDREGLSNAMLEAMAAGVPVLSTPVSGAADALEAAPGETPPGELVAPDPAALAAAIARLAADPARRAAMGAAGRRRIAERFGEDAMLDAWEEVLRG